MWANIFGNRLQILIKTTHLQSGVCEQHWRRGFWGWEHSRKNQSQKPSARGWWCSPFVMICEFLYFSCFLGVNIHFFGNALWFFSFFEVKTLSSPLCLANGSQWSESLSAPAVFVTFWKISKHTFFGNIFYYIFYARKWPWSYLRLSLDHP